MVTTCQTINLATSCRNDKLSELFIPSALQATAASNSYAKFVKKKNTMSMLLCHAEAACRPASRLHCATKKYLRMSGCAPGTPGHQMEALRMDSSAGVRSVALQHAQALALRWSRFGRGSLRPGCASRASRPATSDVCRTHGQAMMASLAPAATLPDHTHTVLKTMTRDSRRHGCPRATADGAGCAHPSSAQEGMHPWV